MKNKEEENLTLIRRFILIIKYRKLNNEKLQNILLNKKLLKFNYIKRYHELSSKAYSIVESRFSCSTWNIK